jgi:hypothetical protein
VQAQVLLTRAHWIQQAITPLEAERYRLATEPDGARVREALDGFDRAWAGVAASWAERGIDVPLEPALRDVRQAGWLDRARQALDRGDVPAARVALARAHDGPLAAAYAALAESYAAVGEAGEPVWAFSAWLELAGVRLKQGDPAAAQHALWNARTVTDLASAEMEAVRRAFDDLASRIGAALVEAGLWPAAAEHFERIVGAPELRKDEGVHAGLALACIELERADCAAEHLARAVAFNTGRTAKEVLARAEALSHRAATDPASYAALVRLGEASQRAAPGDGAVAAVVASALARDPDRLAAWLDGTADCAVRARIVAALQDGSPAEPYLDQARAATACDGSSDVARRALAIAHYRLAVRAWNALAAEPPRDPRTAAPRIEEVRTLLAASDGVAEADALRAKVDSYEAALAANETKKVELRDLERGRRCAARVERVRRARDEPRAPLAVLSDAARDAGDLGTECAAYLDAPARDELAALRAALSARLEKECDAEYYRLPDLPPDLASLGRGRIDDLRARIETFHVACGSAAGSSFRAERVASLLERLGAAGAGR